MKKFILMLSLFSISSFAFADTTAFERFLYEGLEDSKDVQLQTEKTRTEYLNVEVPSTCYRTVWRTRCHTRPPHCLFMAPINGVKAINNVRINKKAVPIIEPPMILPETYPLLISVPIIEIIKTSTCGTIRHHK